MPSANSCLLHVLCFTENQYQTESKRDKNGRRIILEYLDFLEEESMRNGVRGSHETGAHEGGGRDLGGWARPLPRAFLVASLTWTPSLPSCFPSKNNFSVSFYPVWTPFDIGFLRNRKHATNRNWH